MSTHKLPQTLASTFILEAEISIRKDRLLYAGTYETDYFVIHSKPESVAIIALSPTKALLVTNEYRHAVNRVLLGLPGGLLEDGEDPLTGARRELLEETGATSDRFELIGSCYPLPGLLAQKMHVIVAHDVRLATASPEITESIQCSFMPLDALKEAIRARHEVDGILLSSLQLYSLC